MGAWWLVVWLVVWLGVWLVGAWLVVAWCFVDCFVDCFVGAAETAAPPMRAAWIWQDAISSYGRRTESDWAADGI